MYSLSTKCIYQTGALAKELALCFIFKNVHRYTGNTISGDRSLGYDSFIGEKQLNHWPSVLHPITK